MIPHLEKWSETGEKYSTEKIFLTKKEKLCSGSATVKIGTKEKIHFEEFFSHP